MFSFLTSALAGGLLGSKSVFLGLLCVQDSLTLGVLNTGCSGLREKASYYNYSIGNMSSRERSVFKKRETNKTRIYILMQRRKSYICTLGRVV